MSRDFRDAGQRSLPEVRAAAGFETACVARSSIAENFDLPDFPASVVALAIQRDGFVLEVVLPEHFHVAQVSYSRTPPRDRARRAGHCRAGRKHRLVR